MSQKKKGRRHRSVNRTPRPVGSAGRPPRQRTAPPAHAPATAPDLGKVIAQLGFTPARVPAPAAPRESAPAQALSVEADSDDEAGPLFTVPARDGGLGVNAHRTWLRLRSVQGAVRAEELSEKVGYTPRTITKHLKGLAGYGLARQDAEGHWYATGVSQAEATRALPAAHAAL
ncbi:hypothetical protein [Streptomyces sp. cg35]|uniref:hypothetical protein n=1 Tax=Streptomyces sp. cg35 TaxID=3421650 RepID=UPI003D16C1CF